MRSLSRHAAAVGAALAVGVAGSLAAAHPADRTGPPTDRPGPPPDRPGGPPGRQPLTLGVEALLEDLEPLRGQRVGLITNPTGVTQDLTHVIDALVAGQESGGYEVTALYGPEHGVRGGVPAGEYVESYTDERTGLPVYSLYGETRKPTAEMLANVDVLLFDIQDIGARFYTYIWTMYYAMEAAAENGTGFMVLDRPNPLGDHMAGPVLDYPELSSFVGLREIPLQHGMTVGELARYFNGELLETPVDLEVVEMSGYSADDIVEEWDHPWVLPSPNIPTRATALAYPGTGLIESINVSEGRGTTTPFLWFGAPFIDETESWALADDLNARGLEGVRFRPASATPSASKHAGEFSGGLEIHITDPGEYASLRVGLHVLDALFDRIEEVEWREGAQCQSPEDECWIDLLSGSKDVRAQLEADVDPDEILAGFESELDDFAEEVAPYRLYDAG
ncbi:exo-beta-N-acetylmuramidase NamZ domain-containing protein [Georgenia deserti]|uniref:Exo-beta-N-acetylmuramidase NamZ domain-containing protein n=1 Tax=Georgenia deserti TaxID=2093781 RepID=A0ABW4L764_9MICO